MIDDVLTRSWVENHTRSGFGIHKLVEEFLYAMDRLNFHQFHAPWKQHCARCEGTQG